LLNRQPIKGLTVTNITGFETPPVSTGKQVQLSFPWEGYASSGQPGVRH
jgi:hypothetical protein